MSITTVASFAGLKKIMEVGRFASTGCANYPNLSSTDKKQNSTGKKEIIHTDDSVITVFSGKIHTATNKQTVVRYNKDGTMTSSSTKGSFYKGTWTIDETNTVSFAVKGVTDFSNKTEYLEGTISNVDGQIEVACNAFNSKGRYQYVSSTEVMSPLPRVFNCVVKQNAQIINVIGNRLVVSLPRNAAAKFTELYAPDSDNTDLVKIDVPNAYVFENFQGVSGRISIAVGEHSLAGYFDADEAPTIKSNHIEVKVNVRDINMVDLMLSGQTVPVELSFTPGANLANKVTKSLAYKHTVYYPNRPDVGGVSDGEYTNGQTYIDFAKAVIGAHQYRVNE